MRKIIWKLTTGRGLGQETAEEKLAEGMSYVERLKTDGEVVASVENKETHLEILLKDNE